MPMEEVGAIAARLASGEMSGLEGKLLLARTIVTDLHGPQATEEAAKIYASLTEKQSDIDPEILAVFSPVPGQDIVSILKESGLAVSNNAARRLLNDGAVRVNGEKVGESWTFSTNIAGGVLQVGKKKLDNYRRLVAAPQEGE